MENKLDSVNKLNELRDSVANSLKRVVDILVCAGGGCLASGSLDVSAAFKEIVKKHKFDRYSKGNRNRMPRVMRRRPCCYGPA